MRNTALASSKPNLDAAGEADRVLRIQRNAEDELRELLMEVPLFHRQTFPRTWEVNQIVQSKAVSAIDSQKTSNLPNIDRNLTLAEAKEGMPHAHILTGLHQ